MAWRVVVYAGEEILKDGRWLIAATYPGAKDGGLDERVNIVYFLISLEDGTYVRKPTESGHVVMKVLEGFCVDLAELSKQGLL